MRERDNKDNRQRQQENNSGNIKRNSKADVSSDHKSTEEKQQWGSSQDIKHGSGNIVHDHKHPRSAALSGVILPLFSEVKILSSLVFFFL